MKDEESDPYAQTVAFYGLAGFFALIFAIVHGGFQYHLSQNQLLLFIPLAITATIGPVLLFKALKSIDSSESTILFSSENLWIVLGAFIILKEPFSINKILGTLIIILGIAIAFWKQKKFQLNISALLVVSASFFYAGANLISYFLARDFDALSLIVYVCFLPVFTLLLIKPALIKKLAYYFKPKYRIYITVSALNDTLGTLCTYYAYQIGRNAAQISPLMGTITIISVLLAVILLKERSNITNKILGAITVAVGVILVL